MADEFSPNGEDLRTLFNAMAASAMRVSRSLSTLSVERALAWPMPQPGLGLRRCDVSFRLKAVRRNKKVWLWFTKADEREEVLVDVDVMASLCAVPIDAPAAGSSSLPQLRLLLPTFLWVEADTTDRVHYTSLIRRAGDPAPCSRNTLLLRLPDAVLALYVPTTNGTFENDDARLQLTGRDTSYAVRDGPKKRRLRTGDFLLILGVLAEWAAQKVAVRDVGVDAVAVRAASGDLAAEAGDSVSDDRPDVAELVGRIIAAYRELRAALADPANAPPRPDHPWSHQYADLHVDGFAANVALKLDGQGQFPKMKEERYFDLQLSLDAVAAGSGESLLMGVRVVDVVSNAADTKRFVDALLSESAMLDEFASAVGVDRDYAHALLAHADAYVYRVRREEKLKVRVDEDVCAFVMNLEGHPTLAVYQCIFRIDSDGQIEVGVRPSKLLYAGPLAANADLREELIDYFVRLSCTMLRWLNLFDERARV